MSITQDPADVVVRDGVHGAFEVGFVISAAIYFLMRRRSAESA